MTEGHILIMVKLVRILSFLCLRLAAKQKLKNPVFNNIYNEFIGRIYGFIPFPRGLERRETQSALSRIWTYVTNPISLDDNRNTKCTPRGSNHKEVNLVSDHRMLPLHHNSTMFMSCYNGKRNAAAHLLNYLITTASELRE